MEIPTPSVRRLLVSRRRYFPGVRPGSSQVASCKKNDCRCVAVSVVLSIAFRASPFTNRERRLEQEMTAVITQFRGREELIQLDKIPSIPIGFILKLPEDFGERRVTNMLRKFVILE